MLLSKRKHDELEDSEEDEPSYGKQILPVANLPDDFSEEPMNGMQYLFTVRCVVSSYLSNNLFNESTVSAELHASFQT
jgi:hypothetical protein